MQFTVMIRERDTHTRTLPLRTLLLSLPRLTRTRLPLQASKPLSTLTPLALPLFPLVLLFLLLRRRILEKASGIAMHARRLSCLDPRQSTFAH